MNVIRRFKTKTNKQINKQAYTQTNNKKIESTINIAPEYALYKEKFCFSGHIQDR